MKTQLKKHWNRCWCSFLSFSLSLLGFSSCSLEDPTDDPVICMYGTPTACYAVKGKVVDTQGRPLAGIQVTVPRMHYSFVSGSKRTDLLNDTVRVSGKPAPTGTDGTFGWTLSEFPADTVRFDFKFTDIDSLPPHLHSDSVQIRFLRKELEGGDNDWFYGKQEKEITIVLKEENEQ